MWQKGPEANVIAYTAAVSAMRVAKPPGKALELRAAIGQKFLEPDVITYTQR